MKKGDKAAFVIGYFWRDGFIEIYGDICCFVELCRVPNGEGDAIGISRFGPSRFKRKTTCSPSGARTSPQEIASSRTQNGAIEVWWNSEGSEQGYVYHELV
jgi:hypothetical protein